MFDALVVWLCGWGRGDPSRTNLGNSPTSLPTLQVPLGTLGPMHRMISDFFPSLVTCCPSSAIHHFCFFFHSFSFLLQPLCCLPTIPSLVLSGFITCSLISYCFSPLWALPFFTSAPQNISMSPEKQKRNKEIHVTRDTKNTPTGAQVSGLVHIITCLLSPLIFPSCHLCFMVKTNF